MKPDISVIIPTYNRPDAVKRAVRSVLHQSFENFEIIVVNDGEDCELKKYFQEISDRRIVYTNNQRAKGGNGARNTGAVLAKSDYIAFLDDDDEWHKDKIKVHLGEFKKAGGKGCSVSSFYNVPRDFDCFVTGSYKVKPYTFKQKINLQNILLGKVSIGGSSTLLYEKSFFYKIGMMDERLQRHQDLELMFRTTSDCDVIICDNRLVYIHGHNDPPLDKMEKIKQQYFELIDKYLDKLSQKEKKTFYAHEYKKLAISAIRSGRKIMFFKYLCKSLKRDLMPSKKYIKVFYYFVKNII